MLALGILGALPVMVMAQSLNEAPATVPQPVDTSGTSSSTPLTLRGSWPGYTRGTSEAIALAGDYALLAGEGGLSILNISDPANPVRAGSHSTEGRANDVAVSGNLACVAVSTGMEIYDVSDPSAPVRLGRFEKSFGYRGVHVVGQRAYLVAQLNTFEILNISNPGNPVSESILPLTSAAVDLEVAGRYAYVANDFDGLRVIDVNDPHAPTVVGSYQTPGRARDVTVANGYAYVANLDNGLSIVNVSNPAQPSLTGSASVGGRASAVSLAGNFLWVAADYGGVRVFDVSNPSAPWMARSLIVPGLARGIVVGGNHAYVAALTEFVVLTAGNPASVALAGQLFLSGFSASADVAGNHLYLADDVAGLQVLDVSDPSQPTLTTNLAFRSGVQDVRVEGQYAYFTHHGGLSVLNVSNPGNPQQIAEYKLSWTLESFCLAGNLAYTVNGNAGLEIIDISNPARPALIGNVTAATAAVDVFVVGDYAYVADWQGGLKIVNVSDPRRPVLTGVADTPGDASDVYVKAGYAYLVDTFGGLQIIDVRNPSSPVIVSSVPSGSQEPTYGVEVIGSYAYIAQGTNGLAIYDISNPSSPTFVARERRMSNAVGVRVIGNYIYVLGGAAGVTLFENLLPTAEPPEILAQPRSQTIAAGSDATLSITASGSPPLSYQWYRGPAPLPGANSSRLTLTNVSTVGTRNYSVRVGNAHGEVLSSNAALAVLDLGPNFIDHFDPDVDAPQWSQLEGTVQANDYGGSVSPAHSLWFSGNGGRSATTRPLDTRNGAFATFWLRLADSAAYPWENAGSSPGVVFEYSVDERASWTTLGTFNGFTFYGWRHLSYDVPAAARSPRTFFRWRQLGQSADCCDHWALDDVAVITFAAEPFIISQPLSQQVFTAGGATFRVVAAGAPPLSYQWRHNGQAIPGATQSVYAISVAYGHRAGVYSVVLSNALGVAASSNATLTVVDLGGKAFRIDALQGFQPVRVEHQSLTGDDRGGIATSAERVFYSGDNSTAGFLLTGLTNGVASGKIYDALVGDLQTSQVYSLADGTNLLDQSGGAISTLVPLNGTTLESGPPITLSQAIPFTGGGIFAGYGRVVLWDGARVWQIELPSGQVSDLGLLSLGPYAASESWAFWGVAEFWGGSIHLVYVQSPTRIVRTRVPDGQTSTVATFANLGDMACFTVSVPLQRWYFHYQGTNQFGGTNETLAYANASLRIVSGPTFPIIIDHPAGQFVEIGTNITLIVGAFGSEPMRYQWRFNGTNIPGANSFMYPIDNFHAANAGNYDVIVSNDAGTNFSAAAGLSIPRRAYLSALPNVRLSQRGTVNAIAQQQDGKIIIGGTFDWVNEVPRRDLARLHPDGSVDLGWDPKPDSSVQVIQVHGSNIFVAGAFLNIGGQPLPRLAKLDIVTGQADPNWQPNPNMLVRAIAVSGEHLFVGGSFTQILGQTRLSLAKLSLASPAILDPAWNPAPTGAVMSLALSGSDLYVAGGFTNIGGQNRRFIAKLAIDGAGVVDPTWNPNPNGSGLSGVVAVRDNDVFVAGSFSSIGGQTRGGLAKLSASGVGAADPLWNPRATGVVRQIVIDLDRVLVAGTFNGIGGLARTGVAAIDRQGTGRADPAFNAGVNGSVSALALASDGLWVGGNFRRLANSHALSLGKVDPQSGAPVVSLTVHRPGVVQAMAQQPDGKLVFGGIFDRADNIPRGNVARLDENGLVDPLWNPDADGNVSAIAISADAVFLGGFFSQIGGGARVNLARISPNQPGLVDPSWNANVIGGSVSELLIAHNSLFAGGSFTFIGGQSRPFLAKLSPVTALVDPAWNPNPNSSVTALAASTSNLYVGGMFTTIGGTARTLARLDLFNTGSADSWAASLGTPIDTIYLNGPACFVGGSFVQFLPDVPRFIAQLTTSAPALEQGLWRPLPSSTVSAITGRGLDLYAGGSFSAIGGESRGFLARLNPGVPGQADPLWKADADLSVRALNADAEGLYVGGFFSHIAGQPRGGLAFISNEPQAPSFVIQPQNITAAAGETIELAAIANGTEPLRYQWSLNGTDIAGATNRTYIISVVGVGHTGNYRVTISNDFGSQSSEVARVEVIEAPVLSITVEPNVITIRFLSNTGHTYTLERTDALGPNAIWLPVPNAAEIPGTGSALTLTHEAPTLPVRGFYRVLAR